MNVEQLVSAIRVLPVSDRLRIIELAAHDIANDVNHQERSVSEATTATGVRLIERNGLLIAHSESSVALPEEVFEPRVDREVRVEKLWRGT